MYNTSDIHTTLWETYSISNFTYNTTTELFRNDCEKVKRFPVAELKRFFLDTFLLPLGRRNMSLEVWQLRGEDLKTAYSQRYFSLQSEEPLCKLGSMSWEFYPRVPKHGTTQWHNCLSCLSNTHQRAILTREAFSVSKQYL